MSEDKRERELVLRGNTARMEVRGDVDRTAPVVFDPSDDVEDISISVPEQTEEDKHWGQRQRVFVQSARDETGSVREWTHYMQVSTDIPRRFRAMMVHDHPGKHAPETYTLEYTDYGQFKQNDPELAMKLPAEVYQGMLGLSVALREVKLMTQQSLANGEFDRPARYDQQHDWQVAPGIYAISIAENNVIESQWELGLSVSKQMPPQFRSFARNVETGEEYGLFASNPTMFEASHAGLSRLLPEEVYSGMVGMAVGAQMVREKTLEFSGKGEMAKDSAEVNKNRGWSSRMRKERMDKERASEEGLSGGLQA